MSFCFLIFGLVTLAGESVLYRYGVETKGLREEEINEQFRKRKDITVNNHSYVSQSESN